MKKKNSNTHWISEVIIDQERSMTTFDYIDSVIMTRDHHKLNETIKSMYYTLILEDFRDDEIVYYINQKVQDELGKIKNV